MGVVYKLTPDISSFIIDQKRNNARMSCQDLAELVFSKFNQRISKSSVHELLKNAQVIVPRLRRLKPKFQIPPEKKAQLFLGTPSLSPSPSPPLVSVKPDAETPPASPAGGLTVSLPTIKQEFNEPHGFANAGEIFLQCAFYDLSFKPILGLQGYEDIDSLHSDRLRMDWEYLITPIESFKVELEDGTCFYIDARFQGLYDENPKEKSMTTPIERTITEMADGVFNNVKPLIIRNVGAGHAQPLQDFISAFENTPGKTINKIFLVADPAAFLQNARSGAGGQMVTEFNQPLKMRRYFIVGMETSATPGVAGVKILKKDNKTIVTNLNPDRCDVWQMYLDRHPSNVFVETRHASSLPMDDNISNRPQWLKDRLKERALMFFPLDLPPAALDEILALPGKTSATSGVEEVHLQIPTGFSYLVHVQKAAALINNLDISKNKKEKLKVFVA